MANKTNQWTPAELKRLKKLYPHHSNSYIAEQIGTRSRTAIQAQACKLGLRKSRAFMEEKCSRTWFKPGSVPANKGLTWDQYLTPQQQEASRRTLFKPGHRPRNRMAVGAEARTTDGYWRIKVADPDVWRHKHIMLWEQHHGPVPPGHVIYFIDGNKNNITIDNLAMTDHSGHAERTICAMDPCVKKLVQLKGVLSKHIKKAEKQNGNNH